MHQGRRRLALFASGLMAVAAAAPVTATSLIQMSFEDLVDEAAIVVVGEATASRVENSAGGVYTITTFEVSDAIVGGAATVDVATPGGASKPGKFRVSESNAGAPVFLLGGESLLFLSDGAANEYSVVGYTQGAFSVTETAGGKMVRVPGAGKAETIDEVKTRIRAAKANGRDKTSE